MEFIHDFSSETLFNILKKAVSIGLTVHLTEWLNEWEREEGCPSVSRDLTNEEVEKCIKCGNICSIIPFPPSEGCAEINFTSNEGDYICFYHTERKETYICAEALEI